MSVPHHDPLVVAGREYRSRLLVGTGKYKDLDETRRAIEASGAEIVTIAVRRTNIGQNKDEPNVLDVLPPSRYTILPNTAGCYDVKTAVRTCKLARELLDGHDLVKLEVLGDERTLFPDVVATLKAAEELVADGWKVAGSLYPGEDQSNLVGINGRINLIDLDILDAEACRKAVEQFSPDYMFHLAAFASVGKSFSAERLALKVNVEGTLNLLEAARQLKSDARTRDIPIILITQHISDKDMEVMMREFQEFMNGIQEERRKKTDEYNARLNEERRNRQIVQEKTAFGLARISPSATFTLAAASLARTSLDQKERFLGEAGRYQETYGRFMLDKTGIASGLRVIRISDGDREDGEAKASIDPGEIPVFDFHEVSTAECVKGSIPDMGLLLIFNLAFFALAYFRFLRYDVR